MSPTSVFFSCAQGGGGYLKHLALGTLLEEQVLLVEGLQGLACNLGFLFGFACSVIQQVHLDVGSCRSGGEEEQVVDECSQQSGRSFSQSDSR